MEILHKVLWNTSRDLLTNYLWNSSRNYSSNSSENSLRNFDEFRGNYPAGNSGGISRGIRGEISIGTEGIS